MISFKRGGEHYKVEPSWDIVPEHISGGSKLARERIINDILAYYFALDNNHLSMHLVAVEWLEKNGYTIIESSEEDLPEGITF